MRVKSDHNVSRPFFGVYVFFAGRWYRVGQWLDSLHDAEAKMCDLCSFHRGQCFQLRDSDQNVLNAFGTPQTENLPQSVPVA